MVLKFPAWPAGRVILAAGLLLAAGVLSAHPYHQSLLELEVDKTGSRLQAALKLLPEDFDSIRAFTSLDDYLHKNLRLRLGDKPLQMKVEGTDRSPKANWIFLSWPLPAVTCSANQPLVISNRLLFEINDHFVNTVVWREGTNKNRQPKAHNLTPDQPSLRLDITALHPACVDKHHPTARGK